MKLLRVPKFITAFFSQEQAVFWFSSQELLFIWRKKKRRLLLTHHAGFTHGQVSDFHEAVTTITSTGEQEGLTTTQPFVFRAAVVFVATDSSPLERKVVREVFQKAGFQKVTLVSYATAMRAFGERQAIHTGLGLYVGSDVGEGVVFSPQDQAGVVLAHSLLAADHEIQLFLREEGKIEVSLETARELYQLMGRRKEIQSHVVRGRSIQTQQVTTLALKASMVETLREFFTQQLMRELQPLMALPLFVQAQPNHWVVIGDAFLNQLVQEKYQVNTVYLHSEFELIGGVQWMP
ncbi:MAG: hypothetical protein UX28_C0003G0105 [Candidatus Pacebacteria bacterium GW2011_GWA1_46_10]|nr:MAG: hypothetical protein UX28_C0003G0105 [Candidatus Pacebacteria bacterium GW2011_GWA1_46_10]HCR81624.1 hypothetical protein [Candidatus Paceibacterota bacterium]